MWSAWCVWAVLGDTKQVMVVRVLLTTRFPSLPYLTWLILLFETVTSAFTMSFLSLFASYFVAKSQFPHPSICLPMTLSLFTPPPLLLLRRHLRPISVFSSSSMWLQPFSHSTSNQTYSAYWGSSKGPQVDVSLSLHEAPSLCLHLHPSQRLSMGSPWFGLNAWHWHFGMFTSLLPQRLCLAWIVTTVNYHTKTRGHFVDLSQCQCH